MCVQAREWVSTARSKMHRCRSSCLYLLILILHVANTSSQSGDRPLPPLPRDYFSGYVERIISPAADQGTHPSVSLTWSVYDADLELFREDSHDPDTPSGSEQGTLSLVEDWRIGVAYSIDRQSLSCDIKSLDNDQSAVDNFRRRTLQESLLSLNYTYSGTRVVRSLLVDSWTSHDISTGSNITVTFTRPSTAVCSLQSLVESPRLWHYAYNSSSVMNLYGLSFDKPKIDVFDISVCFSDEESELLVLLLPGRRSGVDMNHLRSSIREAIANYTGIYPLQIGNIKIIGKNGRFIVTSVQLSNLTSLATVEDKIPAYKAVQTIRSNLKGQTLPFPVELKPGVNVFPILHDINVVGNSSPSMSSIQPTHSVSSVQSMSSSHWSTHYSPSAVIITPTTSQPLTTSLSSPSSTLQPVVTTTTSAHSTSCPVPPSNSPLRLTVTQTVTNTLPCQPQSTVVVMPTPQPHTAVYPTPRVEGPCTQSLSTGGVIGVAIGAFAGGILTTFLTIVCCVLCCNVCHCNRTSKRSGGWTPLPKTDYNVNVSKEMDYFQ